MSGHTETRYIAIQWAHRSTHGPLTWRARGLAAPAAESIMQIRTGEKKQTGYRASDPAEPGEMQKKKAPEGAFVGALTGGPDRI